jgi:putative nucleotidyltransferase with HDIG domain
VEHRDVALRKAAAGRRERVIAREIPDMAGSRRKAAGRNSMEKTRPTTASNILLLIGLAIVVAAGLIAAADANWDFGLFGVLLVFSIFSDLTAIETTSETKSRRLKISGSFLALVLAIVFLGGTPAAIIGAISILFGWFRWRDPIHDLLLNLLDYMVFPLVTGIAFEAIVSDAGITAEEASFYVLVFATFLVALAINFSMVALDYCYVERSFSAFSRKVHEALIPLLPSELAAALMAVVVAFIYHGIGLAGIALFGIVLVTFQFLLGALIKSQDRAEELAIRSKQLASFQVGMLSALLRTLDLRDQMTARHSAAVARYSRAIAQRAGYSRSQEELVHIAALLHDIGKFILPDRILKANVPLTDEDWMLIRRHPQQGARVVSSLDGYGPVAEIILAHHERIDGKGYPRGLEGDEIPELARIISVADTYDVMTARDSYRTPMPALEAIQELRRVAGRQLDARFVEIFVELLEGQDVSFRHGEAADFERELALDSRIEETASPASRFGRFQPSGIPVG